MPNRCATPVVVLALALLACVSCRARADDPTPPPEPGGLFTPAWPPRTVHNTTGGDWGSLTANSVLGDATAPPSWEDPLQRREWKTDGSWKCPVAGPLFVFGQFGGAGTQVAQQDTKVAGQTGLGCKWSLLEDAELSVRSGPSVTYTDALRPDHVREQSQLLLEVQAHWPLWGKIGLEYQGKAAPALTPMDHDWLDQDLGLAAPLGPNSKVRFGARRHWDDAPDAKPSPDNMQLYFGLELAR
jgi:hypothetical protein